MNPSLTAQQISFFAKNGYLELEELFSREECEKLVDAIQRVLTPEGRDLWRHSPELKALALSRKLSSFATSISPKQMLRLACDQWFPSTYSLSQPTKTKDLFSIQGITAALFLRLEPVTADLPAPTSPIGILPFPKAQGSVLIVRPDLLLNWPSLRTNPALYMIAYAQLNSVYIHNPKDPAGVELRALGYGYGDPLRNDTHPPLKT